MFIDRVTHVGPGGTCLGSQHSGHWGKRIVGSKLVWGVSIERGSRHRVPPISICNWYLLAKGKIVFSSGVPLGIEKTVRKTSS